MLEAVLLLSVASVGSPGLQAPHRPGPTAHDSLPAAPTQSVCALGEGSEVRARGLSDCILTAERVDPEQAPILDGRLDEAVWATAQPATGFRQQEPTPGAPASQRTEARVVYTDEAVYVGMRLFDSSPDSVRAQFVRRDDSEAVSDWASVMFDSYHDRRTSFEFATTPTGTRVDILHMDDVEEDVAWDAVWEVVARLDADGWTAELRIPLSQLRFSAGKDPTWGVNFSRTIARRSEVAYWAPIPPTAGGHVSLYGDLVGLEDLSPPGNLELLPYSVGRVSRAPGDQADPFYEENDLWATAGLDVKYGITSNLTLTATVNPDFGQVEADPSEVNLTAFETFYEEKRPFFTEGTEIFDFSLQPEGYAFYSRRIGRPPQLRPSVPDGGYADATENARILGAVKVSGKTAGGWSMGLLEAVTGRVDADVSGPEGLSSQPLEPLTNYAAGRLMRDFREGASGLGALATAVSRRLSEERLERLRSASYLGAVDWWHRFGSGNNYEFSGWILGTHAQGSEEAMDRTQRSASHFFNRPDADHLTYDPTITTMRGWAAEAVLRRRGGGSWTWSLASGARSPGVELNDLGFLSYADTWYGSFTTRYRDFTAGDHLRNWHLETQLVQAQSWGLENLRQSVHLRGRALFLSFWELSVDVDRYSSHKWPWELRGGPALRRSGATEVRWILESDTRKPWSTDLRATTSFDDQGGAHTLVLDPLVDFRPTPRATVALGPVVSWVRDADQYVAQASSEGDPLYVVGKVEQTTVALEARLSYGFSPTLNLDVYAQPFLSNGSYRDFRTVEDADAADFDERLPLIPAETLTLDPEADQYHMTTYSFRNPDFSVREFRLNAVLRWEYVPGSTLFLVWAQARNDYERLGGLELGRDLDQLFGSAATNVLMVKLNYWIGL